MAQIMYQMREGFDAVDCSHNPEFILMALEDDSDSDSTESLWLAGQAVTKTQSIDY